MTELTIDQALQQGVGAHKAGQVQEADRLYTAILKVQPKHPDANHNMGVLAVSVGKVQEALPFFKTALEANPSISQFWLSYIDALIKLDKFANAKVVLDQAKSKGANGNGFDKLEQRLKEAGQEPLEASKIEPQPKQPSTLDNLKLDQAIKLAKKKEKDGAPEEARRIYQDILVKFPKNKRAIDGLKELAGRRVGKASKVQDPPQDQLQSVINFYNQGQLKQALEQANVLLQQFPSSSVLHNICGSVYKGLGQLDASIDFYSKALAIKPDYADAYNNVGNALKEQGKLKEAIEAYSKALVLKPDYAEAYSNMGNALQEQGNSEEAIAVYNKALVIKPDDSNTSLNLALSLYQTRQYEKAAMFFKKNASSKSQTYLLKCFYEQDEQSNFYDQLAYLINRGENNALIGSHISQSEIRYGVKKPNPFCNEPLKYALMIDLTERYDFENIFVKRAISILNDAAVQNKNQTLLTKGMQTSGNVFNQIGSTGDKIQDIIRMEIENYRLQFKKSTEGLITSWPTDYKLSGWIVQMKNGGAIKPHMHEEGWLSGSIYINVPPKLNKDSGNLVVCLSDELSKYENMKSIDVITGSLCLFPSSLLHYTIPFEADEDRIVLAFDMIPK